MILLFRPDKNAKILKIEPDGTVVIKVQYYAEYARGGQLLTVEGETLEDFESNEIKKNKQVFIGNSGGISVE